MSTGRQLPEETSRLSANDGTAQIARALDAACRDLRIPAEVRALLAEARDALRAASSDAETARLRYHALFDAVPDPVSILDERGIVLDLNKAGMAAYRRPREEIIGQPIEVLNPELPKGHLGPVWDTINRGRTYVIEVTNMRADGTRFPVEVHSAGFEHDGRKCLVAVARDLSSRREAELRYRELMEVIDKGIVVQDEQLNFVYGNSAALRLLGVDSGHSLEEAMQPEHWMIVREDGTVMPEAEYPTVRAIRGGRIIESTLLGLYHRGRRQLSWLSTTVVPQFAADADRPHQVLSMFSDVTALKRDSALFDRVQSLAHIGGWEWDCTSDLLYLTDESARILAQDRAPATMPEMVDCLAPACRLRLRAALDRTIADGRGFDLELQGARADGHAFWVRAIGGAVPGDPATSRLTGTLQDITELKHGEETLRVQARSDPLTGLMNRDAILGEISARLADPGQARVAVLYIDLDRFKVVNDVLGHGAGDELLTNAAHRIVRAVGTEGLIARFGGDEFLVVCNTEDDEHRPERLADAILDAFGDSFRFEKEEFAITASIGIAHAPAHGDRPQVLIHNADAAMYDSKRRIRNGWQMFTPALAQSQQDRLRVETHLRRAADNNEFHLVYQPQVDLRHGRIVAAEALIRWENRQLGEMRPDHFIGHAETTGDIVRIGSWVLREACRQAAEWRDAGLGIVRVAVNVSYRQFLGDDLADTVHGVLEEFGLPGTALELEFTERVLIEDAPDTLRTFARLREQGVVLTIDDFGEGYSALNYLRRLPIHGLKLSQLFMEGVPDNKSDVAVCQAVAGIARSLGLALVAEGVESEQQRRFLLELGVPVGQGFLFAPGLRPEEFARRLADDAVATV
ncbi:sensor domain-containing protein [Luteimonas lutimaris]|uniref:EAL domain-containing protein n=1 Tax=Luteimonas lutimaris TaxID=698645 RepID=A0ABP7MI01_9GAMM